MAQARIGQDYGRAVALAAESCNAQLRQWQSAAAEAGSSGKRRRQRLKGAGRLWALLGGEECELTKMSTPSQV